MPWAANERHGGFPGASASPLQAPGADSRLAVDARRGVAI
jgi:hypothetical protein